MITNEVLTSQVISGHVYLQCGWSYERLLTLVTTHRSLGFMNHDLVAPQGVFRFEGGRAKHANVRSSFTVRFHVLFQISFTCEHFVARWARVPCSLTRLVVFC